MSGDIYVGIHEPIVSKAMFDRVQQHLSRKKNSHAIVHDFLFRRMISCANCDDFLIGDPLREIWTMVNEPRSAL